MHNKIIIGMISQMNPAIPFTNPGVPKAIRHHRTLGLDMSAIDDTLNAETIRGLLPLSIIIMLLIIMRIAPIVSKPVYSEIFLPFKSVHRDVN